MCGIAGMLGLGTSNLAHTLIAMADALRHRGPDADGIWFDSDAGIGLAHRRLAILDLSSSGDQPMASASSRFVLCFNGEIYNHAALRREIEAARPVAWRGHSDTEVLVEAIEHWGVEVALGRCDGMFALAVWDRQTRTLTLARDRMGEKPLYIGQIGGALAFASELKALRCVPSWQGILDRQALGLLLRFGYVPAPLSIHAGIFKLPPACMIQFTAAEVPPALGIEEFSARMQQYWDLGQVAEAGANAPFAGDEADALAILEPLLTDAVRLRMEADVPLGALLSGGVDSSLVVALMQRASERPVRTFSIGFREGRYDEARHARRLASHLGTDHTELHLTPDRALDVIPRLPEVYDEPFADPSQIPTILVSAMAREHVTVALSGDGGDELFLGYHRYANAMAFWHRIGGWPTSARHGLAAGLSITGRATGGRMGFRLWRLGRRIDASDFDAYYTNLLSFALTPTANDCWPNRLLDTAFIPDGLVFPGQRMRFIDQCSYLPEDILTKTDRASMAASLELRVPLLDHRVVEFAWRLPETLLREGDTGKRLLRHLLYRLVPQELVDRPKQGFEIPLDDWLRGPLRDWMLDLLAPSGLRDRGLLDAKAISALVAEHLSGRANHGLALWPALMFESWRRQYG